MTAVGQESVGLLSTGPQPSPLPRLRWTQILAISIFWFALNFHWSALGIIILPSQIFKMVGRGQQAEALAFVLVPGAFIALFANPLFGMLSDRLRGRFASWGRRRPYIIVGTLINIGGLIWLALARDLLSLALAYGLVQLASNAAQAPFHALLPDIVPAEQRGLASGVMGLLQISGSIGGVFVAGLLDATQPLAVYQRQLWLIYGIIIVVLLALMLVTVCAVRERGLRSTSMSKQEASEPAGMSEPQRAWLSKRMGLLVLKTLGGLLLIWGVMVVWNQFVTESLRLSSEGQQVILEVVATIGLLRLFDFHPRRNPDFAWVLLTRLLMMLGFYTIQTFLQFYMKDVVGAPHPEAQTTNFVIVASLTSLLSSLAAGWLSDRVGRKRMVYFSGGGMAGVGLLFILIPSHALPLIMVAGAILGLGYGAYLTVDWALVADVLPSRQHYARDMGVWNISLSLPQIIAPVLGAPVLDFFAQSGHSLLGYQLLFGLAILYCLVATVAVRFVRIVSK